MNIAKSFIAGLRNENCLNPNLMTALLVGSVAFATPAWGQSGQQLFEDLKLISTDIGANDHFGDSVAIENGIVVVGAENAGDNGIQSGSAYLFDNATGAQLFKLLPSDGQAFEQFGHSVAIDSGVVAVGVIAGLAGLVDSGTVYLFDASTGVQLAKLAASDGAASDGFGSSVAMANGILAVGSPRDDDQGINSGSVYLFDIASGAELAKLLPADGSAFTNFGGIIGIAGGIVAVGRPLDGSSGLRSGSAYLFNTTTGAQITKIMPNDLAAEYVFGSSIAIGNGIVAVGAAGDQSNGLRAGSVYLFDSTTGAQIVKIFPNDARSLDVFGSSISIGGGYVVVGALGDDENYGAGVGSAYLFDAQTGAQIIKFNSSDGQAYDEFGAVISIDSNGVVVIGARRQGVAPKNVNPTSPAGVYLFTAPAAACPADMNGDGILDNGDIGTFVSLFLAGCP